MIQRLQLQRDNVDTNVLRKELFFLMIAATTVVEFIFMFIIYNILLKVKEGIFMLTHGM